MLYVRFQQFKETGGVCWTGSGHKFIPVAKCIVIAVCSLVNKFVCPDVRRRHSIIVPVQRTGDAQ